MAGQKESKNILVGAANFFVSVATDTAQALPSLTGTTPASQLLTAATEWKDVGFTQEGVEVSFEPDYGDVEVDQLLDSARIFQQSMRVMVNTTFAEATLENLLVVWGQKANTLAAEVLTIDAGSLGSAPTERSLAFVGPGPRAAGSKERVYHVGRAIQTESSSHALRRSEVTALPVSFRILPGNPDSNGKAAYGTVRDRTIA